jgi:2-dehydropantoate 2-reductase
MRVAIVGAGAIGGFFGALLGRAGHDVALLARGQHLEAIRQHGLQLRSKQFGDFTVPVRGAADASELGSNDLVIVAVKMYDFAAAAQGAKAALAAEGVALTIQNGLDAPQELAKVVGRDRVLAGTISIEATLLEPGVAGHLAPHHTTTIAELEGGPTPRVEALVAAMQAAGITVSTAEDGMAALWQKASGLIPFATLTAAADCSLGEFMTDPTSKALWDDLLNEILAVSAACGYDMQRAVGGWRAFSERGVQATPDFTSSMARDLAAGRRTELEWLTGKIVRLAVEHGLPAPAHRALYAILRLRAGRESQPQKQ